MWYALEEADIYNIKTGDMLVCSERPVESIETFSMLTEEFFIVEKIDLDHIICKKAVVKERSIDYHSPYLFDTERFFANRYWYCYGARQVLGNHS